MTQEGYHNDTHGQTLDLDSSSAEDSELQVFTDSEGEGVAVPEAQNEEDYDSSATETDSVVYVEDTESDEEEEEKARGVEASAPITSKSPVKSEEVQGSTSSSGVPLPNGTKRSYETMRADRSDEEDQNCAICLEMWSNVGDHRLCCLKCGHLFGKSCILNWLVKQKKNYCPQCNKKAVSYDIRELFASKLVALDCSEKVRLEKEIDAIRDEKRQVEIELTKCRMSVESYKMELIKVKGELSKFMGKGEADSNKRVYKFHLEKTLHVPDGSCRVCAYDSFNKTLIVCHQNRTQLFPGFGIKKVYGLGSEYVANNFFLLHAKVIRDLKLHPTNPNLMLTVAFDKCAKLSDLEKQTVIQTFNADYALWSCCWDGDNPNYFYVGTGKGTVHVFDIQSSKFPITELKLVGDTSPVVSIYYVPPKPPWNGGIICCRLNSVVFYEKKGPNEYATHRYYSLVGPFFSLIFDSSTNHILVSSRPSGEVANVRHSYCEVQGEKCIPVHVFIGGKTQSVLSRPCFLKFNDDIVVAVYQENISSVELWSTSSGSKISLFRVSEEIFDLASISIGARTLLATISSSVIRFYEAS